MVPTEAIREFAPAKINLTLHVTGQTAGDFHLLDSLVMFADIGDLVRVRRAEVMSLTVSGPKAAGVPVDAQNLCWRAAEAFGEPVAIELQKNLPTAAGIGGGSSDAAAVLRAMERVFGRRFGGDATRLGADLPVCLLARAARMRGIGEQVQAAELPQLPAVLINPGMALSTPVVFAALNSKDNPPMTGWPTGAAAADLADWLKLQRNDLQAPAIRAQPVIGDVLDELRRCGAMPARMSGSGATCFGLFDSAAAATRAAVTLRPAHPDWWIVATVLN